MVISNQKYVSLTLLSSCLAAGGGGVDTLCVDTTAVTTGNRTQPV